MLCVVWFPALIQLPPKYGRATPFVSVSSSRASLSVSRDSFLEREQTGRDTSSNRCLASQHGTCCFHFTQLKNRCACRLDSYVRIRVRLRPRHFAGSTI